MRAWMKVGIVALALAVAASGWAGEAAKPSLEALSQQLAKWDYGQSRQPKVDMAERIRNAHGNAEERAKLVAALVALLGPADATFACKQFCCEQLSIVADESVVPALVKLLPDAKLHHPARMGLERIPGDKASAALRDFLPKAKDKLLIGTVNSLGERRDAAAAPAIARLLSGKDPEVVKAAAIALGKIGGQAAIDALGKAEDTASGTVHLVVAGSYLHCADHLVAAGKADQAWGIYGEMYDAKQPQTIRVAALRGMVSANREKAAPIVATLLTGGDPAMQAIATEFVREGKSPAETKLYVGLLGKMKPEGQALLIAALADRGDAAALPAVVEAAKGQDAAVRATALNALASLGNASTAPFLAEIAAKGEGNDKKAAAQSLDRLSGDGVDEAILKLLSHSDPAIQAVAIRSAAARRIAKAVPALLGLAGGKEASVRVEALRALGVLAGQAELPKMVALLVKATGGEQRTAEDAVKEVCSRIADPAQRVAPLLAAMPKAEVSARCALLRLLGRVGGAPALKATRDALGSQDPKIHETALRTLANWVDPTAAPDLMAMVKASNDPKEQVIAFRGYVHAADLRARENVGEGLKMYQQAMGIAPRLDEKKLVLGSIGNVRHPAALQPALGYLADAELKAEAAAAVKKIAGAIRRSNKKEADAALKAVQDAMKKK